MGGQLKEIFTTWRAYPNGAIGLTSAIEKALQQCTRAVREFDVAHGAIITKYNAGLYRDQSEKNIIYEISRPQPDVADGNCVCTVGSFLAQGILPTKRPIGLNDNALALAICLGKREPFLPSIIDFYQKIARMLQVSIYVKTFSTKECWAVHANSVEIYQVANDQ